MENIVVVKKTWHEPVLKEIEMDLTAAGSNPGALEGGYTHT